MMGKRNVFCCIFFLSLTGIASAQPGKEEWVDSVFQTLSENEKIGQLFFARFSSHADNDFVRSLEKKVGSGDFGGVVFTSGTPAKQVRITNRLQSEAKVPLLISQDASHGLGYLLDSALVLPSPLAQGAISNDSLIYWIGRDIGKQLKSLGVHMSLSPNATPVHSETTHADYLFGNDRHAVAKKSLLHMKGLHAEGILSCAKYFPLKSIEVIDQKGKANITLYHDTLVSYPYLRLFEQGLDAVIPDASDLPRFFGPKLAELKKKLSEESFEQFETGDLLHQFGYDGIVMIDLRSMQPDADRFAPGDAALVAFQAGADIIISDEDPDPATRKIKKLLHTDKKYDNLLDQKIKKILAMKYAAGLFRQKQVNTSALNEGLYSIESRLLRSRAFRESITVIRNEGNVLPIRLLEGRNFSCVITGDSTQLANTFHKSVRKYVPANRIFIHDAVQDVDLSATDVALVAIFPGTSRKVMQNLMGTLQELAAHQQVVVADFGCPAFEEYADRFPAIVTAYSDENDVVGVVPQMIFGALPARGILPRDYGEIPSGTAVLTPDLARLAYGFPEEAGIDGATLERINVIANEAIASGSTPGCYVLVARNGKVIYDKAFGHLTYEKQVPVSEETIYDLASLTKVSATLQAVMFMQERGLIDINKKLSVYLPELKGTNKKDITIVDVLTHQAGLAPFIPLWPLTLEGPVLKPMYYSSQQNVKYPLQIAPTLFGSPILRDSVWSWITFSKMMDKPKRTTYPYRYSDLGFMMFKQLAERTLNQPMEDFLQQNFYEPLGAYSLGYTPLDRFPAEVIAPTELDTIFRGGLLIGTVHDERAAMLGGVSGHAGLFGTAKDLSKLGQMLLQGGTYGGTQYYKPETVRLFTAKQFESSRRGLGWDKPVQSEWNSPTSRFASPATFGHTGFTGTCLWVDPEFNLVYIFLSNRVFPDRSDKLIQANIRSRIQDVVYEALFNFCKTHESVNFQEKTTGEQ